MHSEHQYDGAISEIAMQSLRWGPEADFLDIGGCLAIRMTPERGSRRGRGR